MFSDLLAELRPTLVLVLISLVLIVLDNYHLLNLPKGAIQTITSPLQYGFYKTGQGLGKQFEFIALSRTAAQENKAMAEQLASVLSENANLRRQLAEAQGFLEQQKSLDPRVYNLVAARPIGLSRYLSIDKGTDDGIEPGQSVVYKDSLLGIVKEASAKSSEVILASDPDSKIAAFSQSSSGKSRGVLIGQFGSDMLLDKILHQETIKVGDLVYTEGVGSDSGSGGKLPRGLVLGQVTQVLERENEVFKQAKVKSVFPISDLDIVFVITN